jgi:hypothetical protein
MTLSPAQLQTLKAAILADPVLNAYPNYGDGPNDIANLLNQQASPPFTVWKTSVPISDVGRAMNSNEIAGLTTANTSRLQVMAMFSGEVFNPSFADVRAGFDNIFSGSGGVNTRAALLILWKRLATRGEKIFAIGTGSDASPATLTFEGNLSANAVQQARNS